MRSAWSKPFHYRAIVGEPDFRQDEVIVQGSAVPPVGDGARIPDDQFTDIRYPRLSPERRQLGLVGPAPRIRFWQDRMVLISAHPHEESLARWCGFVVGDVIVRAARVGDEIQVYRGVFDGLSLALFRDGRLIAAVGDLVGVEGDRAMRRADVDFRVRVDQPRHVQIGGNSAQLATRESRCIGGYDVYVEAWPWRESLYQSHFPSSLSVALADDLVLVNSARRSAVLMRIPAGYSLYGEMTDGTFLRSQSDVP